MHAPLGNHFAVEVGHFFQMPYILQQQRATRAGTLGILVIGHGAPAAVVISSSSFSLIRFHHQGDRQGWPLCQTRHPAPRSDGGRKIARQ
jgi:hypothetical protein